ncbi:hypothetical protein JCM10213v2_005955 [Rhodosporidiobolus nylandii]
MPLPSQAYYTSPASAAPAPDDDWETAYSRDEEQQSEQVKNARLWQDANTAKPTYSILPSSSSASVYRAPPSAALNEATTNGPPQLKILKRPTSAAPPAPASSSSRSSSGEGRSRSEKTLAEREKEYAEARRRIYGDEAMEEKAGKDAGKAGCTEQGGTALALPATPFNGFERRIPGLSRSSPAGFFRRASAEGTEQRRRWIRSRHSSLTCAPRTTAAGPGTPGASSPSFGPAGQLAVRAPASPTARQVSEHDPPGYSEDVQAEQARQ